MFKQAVPTYNDGIAEFYELKKDNSQGDFHQDILKDMKLKVWFRELSIFDRTRLDFERSNIEVQMKIRIPEYRAITNKHFVIIQNQQFKIFNVAHLVDSRLGIKETELTLITPEKEYEVIE